MTDQAPVSSQHVRLKLVKMADVPERELMRISIVTTITRDDRAETTVTIPQTPRRDVQHQWYQEMQKALQALDGTRTVSMAGVSQTFTVTWDGICRPI